MAGVVTKYLNLIGGFIFILLIGFFVMQIVLAAISLATDFDNSKKTYEGATKQLTGAIKGLVLALVTFFLLNTILLVLGVTTPTETITATLGTQFDALFSCLRDFRSCAP